MQFFSTLKILKKFRNFMNFLKILKFGKKIFFLEFYEILENFEKSVSHAVLTLDLYHPSGRLPLGEIGFSG
jgi:hypothetical protein